MVSLIQKENEEMWRPNASLETNMDKFVNLINKKHGLSFNAKGNDGYTNFHSWTCEEYDKFWGDFFEFADIIHSQPPIEVVDKTKKVSDVPEWFRGAKLNYAEQALRWDDEKVALITCGEQQIDTQTTYKELKLLVARIATSLREMGIQKGDRVAGYVPNTLETTAFMLAVASIGAIWSSTSPDFGVQGVLDRFKQVQPKILLSVNAVVYNNKVHDHSKKVAQVVSGLDSLEKVVIFDFVSEYDYDIESIHKHACTWNSFVVSDAEAQPLIFEQLPFNHPLFIMYSSGTTGSPKCMVHSAGGTMIQHMKEMIIHGDVTRESVLFFYTTTGWMMWNWLMGGLLCGATVVLYDGSPFHPKDTTIFDLAEKYKFTALGTSPKWLQTCEARNLHPMQTHDLSHLKVIFSTGAPLTPDCFEYVYRKIKPDVLLGSISGGTDIISCFAGSNPNIPVHKGDIQSANLGMAIESWVGQNEKVFDKSGELVCIKPFPCQPVSFWNDHDGSKYQKAYFSDFEGVWSHGDFVQINSKTGGITMQGRSDGTLNPSGVRFGSAEIYNVTDQFKDLIKDALCVGQKLTDSDDERVILFLHLQDGIVFSDDLVKKIKIAIRSNLSARHVPAIILETTSIPYTINGKKIETMVKKAIAGEEVKVRSSFADPKSLDFYYNIPELKL